MEDELAWPLRGWEAAEAGLLWFRELRRFYAPVYPGVHIPLDVELSLLSVYEQPGCGPAAAVYPQACRPLRLRARSG
jgi:hypothetical protein